MLVATHRRRRHQGELGARLGRLPRRRARHRQPLHQRRPRAGRGPLFFLDYSPSRLDRSWSPRSWPDGRGCAAAGCALLGGETAEMPGVYAPGEFDVAGTLIGVVERRELLGRGEIVAGDVLVGIGVERAAHERLLAPAHVFQWLPTDSPQGSPAPSARRCCAASQLPSTCSTAPGGAEGQGAGAHHRRRPAGEPATGPSRQGATRRSSSAHGRPRRCSNSSRHCDRSRRAGAAPHAEHGDRDGRRHGPERRRRGCRPRSTKTPGASASWWRATRTLRGSGSSPADDSQASSKRMRRLRLPLLSTLPMRNGRDSARVRQVGAPAGLTVDAVDVDDAQPPVGGRRGRDPQAADQPGGGRDLRRRPRNRTAHVERPTDHVVLTAASRLRNVSLSTSDRSKSSCARCRRR